MSTAEENLKQMTDLMGNHSITDEDGYMTESDTAPEETVAQEENDFQEDEVDEELNPDDDFAEDEKGKKYIPEKRFKKVYGEREAERRARISAEQQVQELAAKLGRIEQPYTPSAPLDLDSKTAMLEIDLMHSQLPQFDPHSSSYSPALDELATNIFIANPGMTRIRAARKAIQFSENLSKDVVVAKQEAREVKSARSDSGMQNRVLNRSSKEVDYSSMTLAQKERFLKESGSW